MDYVIVSTAVTDDINLADGTRIGCRLGGAGIYALSGICLWTDSAVLVTGIGADFTDKYFSWFDENACSQKGLMIKADHTAVSKVVYQADGERVETPVYGKDHYRKLEASPEELIPFMKNAKGVYIFKEAYEEYWDKILSYKMKYGFDLLWEINADSCKPEYLEYAKALAGRCEVFSINRTEACSLLNVKNTDEAISVLKTWETPMIYLRLGSNGACVIRKGEPVMIPCVPTVNVVDPTGAGNSSSAAVLYGYCEGYDAQDCGLMGSISAAACIEQYGPPKSLKEKTADAKELLMMMRRDYYVEK